MENPKVVHQALATVAIMASLASGGLSLYLWDVRPIAIWGFFIAALAVAFMIITVVYSVTVWPLLLLIGRVFDRRSKTTPPTVGSAEPPAATDCGHDTPGRARTRPVGRGG